MISICPCCSRVDYEKIEKMFGEDNVEVGCLGKCEPIPGKSFGFIGDDFIVTDTEEEFINLIKNHLK